MSRRERGRIGWQEREGSASLQDSLKRTRHIEPHQETEQSDQDRHAKKEGQAARHRRLSL
ncbi:MAG: hypothetical protein CUN51_03085 [Candidatus Thermofonsia Clade 1 bacterium]|uniref:Uncharacterized protein n=1 Tax=Candidatus Thermofonsia Clade 1 bacterium TaxID=2364210 RepID=A0A2M8P314_9CHLR|nr:MAG: hypothetical protein CUN51_03085 [Candidatus Thermofonsia Clade 1 bacterium]